MTDENYAKKGDVMRKSIIVSTVVILIHSTLLHVQAALPASLPLMPWQELYDNLDLVSSSGPWYLINVLPRDIYVDCSLPHSINIPTHRLSKKLASPKKWPRNRKIIIYCAGMDCPLSKYAYQALVELGFKDIWVLDGGIRQWKQNMLTVQGVCQSGYLHG